MRWILIAPLGTHGLIHLLGFAKAFGYANLPQLTQPISRALGVVWLTAACLIAATTAMLGAGSRTYWIVGAVALVVSQAVIVSAWRDAWAGTIVNVILLLVVAHGWLTEGPRGASTRSTSATPTPASRARSRPRSSLKLTWLRCQILYSDTFA